MKTPSTEPPTVEERIRIDIKDDEDPGNKEWRTVGKGIVYSIGIIIILLLIISFLFLAERNPEEIEGPEEPEVLITYSDYPDFFNNDTSHYPDGFISVDGDRCFLCHDRYEGSGDKIIYKQQSFEIRNSTLTESTLKCYRCHVDPKHKTKSPYNICTECHYQDNHNSLSLSFNNVLSRLGEINNDFCIECHEEECSELQKVGHTHEDVCTNCHNDHKIIPGCLDCHDPSFIGPYHNLASAEFEICTDCHKGGAHTKPIINDDMDCSVCHSDIYAERLENFGGRHFTSPGLGKCSSCHTAHREYPDCRDCHGNFPEHLENTAVDDPNQDCRVCHTGGAHDSRVTYSNYRPDLGDRICEVCHKTEYEVYYEESTPGELAIYGNCLDCHEEHNTEIVIPHITPLNFLDCNDCHEGYNGPDTMHVISNTSFFSFPYTDVPNEFCSNCHSSEYRSITTNSTPEFEKNYGGCTDCHIDHKSISYSHFVEGPYSDCKLCHKTFDSRISIHNPVNITYGDVSFSISDEFCSACHKAQNDLLKQGIHESRNCTDCHGEHKELVVDFDRCTLCHTDIPPAHYDEELICSDCHDTTFIHSAS